MHDSLPVNNVSMMKIFSNNNGERVYKLRGNMTVEQINAGREHVSLLFAYPTLYINPYMVITPQGYTKYYYMGTDRVAAQIGKVSHMQSLFAEPIELHSDTGTTFVDIDGEAYDELQWQCFGGDRLWQITIACDSDILLPILRRDSGAADTRVSGKYFYHTDHLGSANWVTKGDEAVQFIHYMPYGEMWYNQRGSAYNERYKYTGKERDEETGNDYFGARYYAAYTPMWLSPDPLMDKYPSISPYAYCAWNPLKYVDPDGMEKIVSLSPTMKSTSVINNAAKSFPENPSVIHIWAHGNKNGIQTYNRETSRLETITSAEGLNAFLMNQSEIWQNRETAEPAIVVLHSCSTGEGYNSIAEQMSSSEFFNNVIIVAPSRDIVVLNGIEYGPANKNNLENIGEWKMFLNGNIVNSFSGKSTPIFNNPSQQVERYNKCINE